MLFSYYFYYFNVTIITDRRVIDIDQVDFFHRDISETNLVDIKESYTEQKGILQNLFNYGTVYIQVPATVQNIDIDSVENPREIARIINDLHTQVIKNQKLRVVDAQQAEQMENNPS